MSYNGSGTFVINTAGQPVVSGTVISSTAFNALTADLATGLSTAITKDGQTTPTANIPMGNNKITGLAVGTAATDAANLSQVQSTTAKLINSVSGADTVTGTMSPTLTAYAAGQMFYWIAAGANTGAVTLNIDSLGAKAVTRDGSTALTAGDLRSGEVIVVVYDGTRFQVVSQVNSGGDATFANVSITSALNVGGVATFTGNPVLSGGTANGVLYLNGSKVATSGSALVFDGTRLGLNVTPSANQGRIQANGAGQSWFKFYDSTAGWNFGTFYKADGSTALAYLGGGGGSAIAGGTVDDFVVRSEGNLLFAVSTTERMRLDSSGNLGIGTSSPTTKLHVQGGQVSDGGITYNQQLTSTAAYNASPMTGSFVSLQYNSGGSYAGMGGWAVAKENATDGNYSGYFSIFTRANAGSTTERLRIDSSGNLGLGVTPSAWQSATYAIEVGPSSSLSNIGTTTGVTLGANVYYNAGWKYKLTDEKSTLYTQFNGVHSWSTAGTGTAGNTITFTQAMTLDASGRLGIKATTPGYNLQVNAANPANGVIAQFYNDATSSLNGAFAIISQFGIDDWFIGQPAGTSALTFGNGKTSSAAGTERARITSGGRFFVNATALAIDSTVTFAGAIYGKGGGTADQGGGLVGEQTATSYFSIGGLANNTSYADLGILSACTRSANSAYNLFTGVSGISGSSIGDTEFALRGDGNGYADGTWNNNGADYAEYFESATGGALTVGATVVLDGNKVREATASDPVSAIMGVVRPKEPGKASMVVGNTAWNKWANKYLTDDFDRYIMEDHDVVEWTDEDGKQHSYESHNIPNGVTVPADAVRKTHDEKGNKFQHYKLNPAWDKDAEYTPREKRPEWNIIGLVGQVKVLKGKPVNDRWIKMRDVSAAVEEWMIR